MQHNDPASNHGNISSQSQSLEDLIELHFKISDIRLSLDHVDCDFLRRIFRLFELELQTKMNALNPPE